MIRDINIPIFLRRQSDKVFEGRNRTRIILGTDRKKGVNSGWGDGGEKDLDSGTIDIIAGYKEENPNYLEDLARLYLSGKTNPDEYFGIEKGQKARGEAAGVLSSDNAYIIGRKKIKIIVPNTAVILINNGEISIEANNNLSIKSGQSSLEMDQAGNISLGSPGGLPKRILTENDVCVGVAPSGGGPVVSNFKIPTGGVQPLINNQKVKIK